MSKRHTTDSDLEMYVLGALPPRRRAEVEQHVQGCTQCGDRLAREARLEVALWELGRALPAAPKEAEAEAPILDLEAARQRRMGALARGWGRGMAALTAMGVAAAALLMVRGPKTLVDEDPRLRPPPGGAPERVAEPAPRLRPWACPDDPTGLHECQAAARRQGLYLPVASQPDEFFGYRTLAGAGDGLGVSGPGKNWRTLVHRPWRGRD